MHSRGLVLNYDKKVTFLSNKISESDEGVCEQSSLHSMLRVRQSVYIQPRHTDLDVCCMIIKWRRGGAVGIVCFS